MSGTVHPSKSTVWTCIHTLITDVGDGSQGMVDLPYRWVGEPAGASGGLGITLKAEDMVIFYDQDWVRGLSLGVANANGRRMR